MTSLSKKRGFSLVELMVSVAIVGILAAVAIPSYTKYVNNSRKKAAQSFLVELSQMQAQSLSDSRAYKTAVADLVSTTPTDVSNYYTITIDVVTGPPPRYTLTATPKSGTAMAGTSTLTLNSAGVKAPSTDW